MAFADAGYAKFDYQRSVSGEAAIYCGAVVGFFSRTHEYVTLSTMQAEYVAVGDVVNEAVFVSGVEIHAAARGRDVHSVNGVRIQPGENTACELSSEFTHNSKHIYMCDIIFRGNR